MKAVKRWRYYCDHCKKAGNSGGHMKNHESSCTLNPERVCKLCQKMGDVTQAPMAEMMALLPDPALFMVTRPAEYENEIFFMEGDGPICWMPERVELDDDAFKPLLALAMPKLRELASNCPICILAALRQKKIPVPLADGFDFKKELDALWVEINEYKQERRYG